MGGTWAEAGAAHERRPGGHTGGGMGGTWAETWAGPGSQCKYTGGATATLSDATAATATLPDAWPTCLTDQCRYSAASRADRSRRAPRDPSPHPPTMARSRDSASAALWLADLGGQDGLGWGSAGCYKQVAGSHTHTSPPPNIPIFSLATPPLLQATTRTCSSPQRPSLVDKGASPPLPAHMMHQRTSWMR